MLKDLRIVGLEATPISIPFARAEQWALGEWRGTSTIVLQIRTQDGITGIGEVVPGGPSPQVSLAALEALTPLLEGRDAGDICRNIQRLRYAGGWHWFPRQANLILAGVEVALWDILGKAVGQPVHRFFGGQLRPDIEFMYFLMRSPDPASMISEARSARDSGFRSIYVKLGTEIDEDVEFIRGLRTELGQSVRIRVDANEEWTPGTALRALAKLEEHDLEFIEQPVRNSDLDTLARLRTLTRVPIAADQSAWTSERILEIVQRKAADVILTDPHREGGLMGFRHAGAICEAAGLPIVYHAFTLLSLSVTAAMHVLSVMPNALLAHQAYPPGFLSHDVTEPLDISTGRATVPQAPGLGVQLDPEKLALAARHYEEVGTYPMFGEAEDFVWIPKE